MYACATYIENNQMGKMLIRESRWRLYMIIILYFFNFSIGLKFFKVKTREKKEIRYQLLNKSTLHWYCNKSYKSAFYKSTISSLALSFNRHMTLDGSLASEWVFLICEMGSTHTWVTRLWVSFSNLWDGEYSYQADEGRDIPKLAFACETLGTIPRASARGTYSLQLWWPENPGFCWFGFCFFSSSPLGKRALGRKVSSVPSQGLTRGTCWGDHRVRRGGPGSSQGCWKAWHSSEWKDPVRAKRSVARSQGTQETVREKAFCFNCTHWPLGVSARWNRNISWPLRGTALYPRERHCF